MPTNDPQLTYDEENKCFQCTGLWSVLRLNDFYTRFCAKKLPEKQELIIDGGGITGFDSAGALILTKCVEELKSKNNQIEFKDFSENQNKLLELLHSKYSEITKELPEPKKEGMLYSIGKEAENKLKQADGLVILIGDLSTCFIQAFGSLRRFQIPSIVANIYSAGIQALPIVALLSFLIGVVLAYQMGLQLETYGANIFIAYLSGMAIFREFAPLITAIIVAGRTSSSFTAQIGSMKLNEEIDALLTMGLSPTELLVLPKVLGLLIVFPLLIFWSDFFSILGAMLMSKTMLEISCYCI